MKSMLYPIAGECAFSIWIVQRPPRKTEVPLESAFTHHSLLQSQQLRPNLTHAVMNPGRYSGLFTLIQMRSSGVRAYNQKYLPSNLIIRNGEVGGTWQLASLHGELMTSIHKLSSYKYWILTQPHSGEVKSQKAYLSCPKFY